MNLNALRRGAEERRRTTVCVPKAKSERAVGVFMVVLDGRWLLRSRARRARCGEETFGTGIGQHPYRVRGGIRILLIGSSPAMLRYATSSSMVTIFFRGTLKQVICVKG
jgi:hypothetical protein